MVDTMEPMSTHTKRRPKDPTPVAKYMVTSGLFRSRQVPNKKRQANRLACRKAVAD